ncbi:MAG: BamA/TamA family outer membrane protein [bacterium]
MRTINQILGHAVAFGLLTIVSLSTTVMATDNSHPSLTAAACRIDTIYVTESGRRDTLLVDLAFTAQQLEKLARDILRPYQQRGHYWATAKVTTVRRSASRITLEMNVVGGPLVTLADCFYTGLTRTNPALVARYLPIHTGDTLTEALVDRATTAAAGLDFLTYHSPPVIRPLAGYTDADLQLHFSEKRQFTFSGGGGYLPDDDAGLVWHLNLRFNNLFGSGRRAAVRSQRLQQGHRQLRLHYGQPLFLIGVGQLDIEVGTRDYRDMFYEFSLEGSYVLRLQTRLSAGLNLGWRNVASATDQPSYSRFSSGFSLERRARDHPLNPSRGHYLKWSMDYSYRRYRGEGPAESSGQAAFNETRVSVVMEWYQPLVAGLVAHLALKYRGLQTDERLPPPAELILVGGPGTVRGFRREQFAAVRSACATLEPRLRFSRGYLMAFYDAAYINNRVAGIAGAVRTDELYRFGYGIGIALLNDGRAIRLSLAWQPDLPFDQPWLSAEFSSDI